MREQRRRRQPFGNRTLRRRRLVQRAAAPAAVFGTADPDHPKLGRNPVQHLADRLADRVESTAAAGAEACVEIGRHLLPRQMSRQLAARRSPGRLARLGRRAALQDLGDIGVEVFEAECQLVRIELFGAMSELRPLQLPHDEPEPLGFGLDLSQLGSIRLNPRRHLAHQTVQQRRVVRQVLQIETHAGFYASGSIQPRLSL